MMTKGPKLGVYHVRSWQDAAANAARWMRYWGYADAVVEPGGQAEGLAVRARGAGGHVSFKESSSVDRAALQHVADASAHSGGRLVIFTDTTFSRHAVTYADEHGIALFRYGSDGTMAAANSIADSMAQSSVAEAFPTQQPSWLGWVLLGLVFAACLLSFGLHFGLHGAVYLFVLVGAFGLLWFWKRLRQLLIKCGGS